MPKIVNGNLYLHRQYIHILSPELIDKVDLALHHLPISCDWNLVKIDSNGTHITFSNYPDFELLPHPELKQWNRIDVISGVATTGIGSTDNPIILHRKETFIDQSDSNYDIFTHLTRQEIAAGLYARENLSRIGHKKYWEQLLDIKGLKIIDHSLYFATGIEFETSFRLGKER
ncbi:MAG: hypothetical protein ACD_61C00115G0001 [uncultured bacterium]|nr:MAG: hypothetical protein ACD_61C00115G0001 [uncultured bacterium]